MVDIIILLIVFPDNHSNANMKTWVCDSILMPILFWGISDHTAKTWFINHGQLGWPLEIYANQSSNTKVNCLDTAVWEHPGQINSQKFYQRQEVITGKEINIEALGLKFWNHKYVDALIIGFHYKSKDEFYRTNSTTTFDSILRKQ